MKKPENDNDEFVTFEEILLGKIKGDPNLLQEILEDACAAFKREEYQTATQLLKAYILAAEKLHDASEHLEKTEDRIRQILNKEDGLSKDMLEKLLAFFQG